MLTNSLAATDVPAVHAGTKGYRRDLLEAGVELYEPRPSGEAVMEGYRKGLLESSSASLHAKTFISDRERILVGSLNLDPRSLHLNTELGLVVESAELVWLGRPMERTPELALDRQPTEHGDPETRPPAKRTRCCELPSEFHVLVSHSHGAMDLVLDELGEPIGAPESLPPNAGCPCRAVLKLRKICLIAHCESVSRPTQARQFRR